jgi:hypothetical protein
MAEYGTPTLPPQPGQIAGTAGPMTCLRQAAMVF